MIVFTLENSSVISGEIRNPGIYPTYNVSSPLDLLSFAGGPTDKFSGKMNLFTDDGRSLNLSFDEQDMTHSELIQVFMLTCLPK